MSDPFAGDEALFRETQRAIVRALEGLESARGGPEFRRDQWRRSGSDGGPIEGGGGLTCVLEGGAVFERAGVNVSAVHGRFTPALADALPGEGLDFRACGVSLVVHPRSPHVPVVHMNHRRLSRGATGWYGGGIDLTPFYLDEADCRHFHGVLRGVCDRHPRVADYAAFKRACDEYFRNTHRGEARGIGGTFFDHLPACDETRAFITDSCAAFLDAYLPIVERHIGASFSEQERAWQTLRRGRYVEFNLLHDRGTAFGLRTGGRIESILMSMPPEVSWRYDHEPAPGSREAALVDVLINPRPWA